MVTRQTLPDCGLLPLTRYTLRQKSARVSKRRRDRPTNSMTRPISPNGTIPAPQTRGLGSSITGLGREWSLGPTAKARATRKTQPLSTPPATCFAVVFLCRLLLSTRNVIGPQYFQRNRLLHQAHDLGTTEQVFPIYHASETGVEAASQPFRFALRDLATVPASQVRLVHSSPAYFWSRVSALDSSSDVQSPGSMIWPVKMANCLTK